MHDKSKFDELLISYLSNELDPEDEAFVLEWINFSKQNRQYFEELHTVWKLLGVEPGIENIDVTDEWNRFRQEVTDKQQNYFPPDLEKTAGTNTSGGEPQTKRVLYRMVYMAGAAAALLAIVLTVNFLIARKPVKPVDSTRVDKGSVPALLTRQKNTSGKPKRFVLSDGSEILLTDKSELSYLEPFTGNRRDVMLQGSAGFSVTKNNAKPFTVITGDLSTTVLGTRFTVTAFEHATSITVRLYEGKVLVKAGRGDKRKDTYLSPGEELIYNNLSSTATIRKFREVAGKKKAVRNIQAHDHPSFPSKEEGSWYMFNNQSLDEVLGLLQDMHGATISYSKKTVRNKYFIGKFKKTDSLENVLQQITSLNNLKLVKNGDQFIITK